ncbi:MAG: hypothetical protein AAB941_01100 [Patescibacteria group bacterium]
MTSETCFRNYLKGNRDHAIATLQQTFIANDVRTVPNNEEMVFNQFPEWNGVWMCTKGCTYRFCGYHEGECHFVLKSPEEIKRLRDEADGKK